MLVQYGELFLCDSKLVLPIYMTKTFLSSDLTHLMGAAVHKPAHRPHPALLCATLQNPVCLFCTEPNTTLRSNV